MRPQRKGFGIIEILIVLGVVIVISFLGYYALRPKKASPSSSPSATPSAKKTTTPSPTPTLKSVKIEPEGIFFQVPQAIVVDSVITMQPVGPSDYTGGTTGIPVTFTLDDGFRIQVEVLTAAATNNSYGNLGAATSVDNFIYQGKTYYIVDDHSGLYVSTCNNKVCAPVSKLNSANGIIASVTYADPSEKTHQQPDDPPLTNSYMPTVLTIMKSFTY